MYGNQGFTQRLVTGVSTAASRGTMYQLQQCSRFETSTNTDDRLQHDCAVVNVLTAIA